MKKVKKVKKNKKSNLKKKDRKGNKSHRAWWKWLVSIIIIGIALCIFAVGGFLLYIVVTTSNFDPEALESQEQTIIYSADGKEIAQLGYELREKVTYDQLPQVLIDAIVATEDSRFFQHNGVDLPRFLKATLGQLTGNSSAGGASTLTMQVVKNNLTSTEKSIIRKFKDMYLATFFMERQYSKEEILEFYVNDSLLGGNVYGVEEASQYYFGKSVSELSLPEAALIAGLYQSPNGYNPYYNPENANKRIKTVLKLMVKHGYITQEEADIAGSIDISTLLVGLGDSGNVYQGYIDTVIEEVESKTGNSPYLVSMKIYTALDTKMQDGINAIFKGETFNWPDDKVQAGTTIVDTNTGEIVAVGTGRKENNDALTWNFATRETRQPGSTAKPIFAYGPAMEYDNYSTYSLFMDEKWSYSDGTSVSNWDNSYSGLMTLREALAQSRNIPAIKAFQQVNKNVGNDKIVEFAENLGIDIGGVAYESYAIGGLSNGVTTSQMAGAYAAFANGGYYNTPHTVTKIEYRETGEVQEYNGENKKVMSESTAYLMNNALEYACNNGFSGGAKVSGSHVAVKTGTSNFSQETIDAYKLPSSAENDLWSVAYTKNYSVAVWYGYRNVKEGYNTTDRYKNQLMAAVIKFIPKETEGWSVPNSVKEVRVEKETWPAKLASEYTPSNLISTEYFKAGTEPTEVSERFNKLSDVSNLSATSSKGSITLTWEGKSPEVIDKDYLSNYFKQSVFGNSSSAYLNNRLSYNSNTLGEFGYGIYIKDSDGTLTRVGWTSDNVYTYSPTTSSKNLTLVVKSEYKIFKSNASGGVSTDVTVSGTSDNGSSLPGGSTGTVSVVLENSSIYLGIGEADSSDFGFTVNYNGKDVTKSSSIKYSISGNGQTISCESIEQLVKEVKMLESGNYTITYSVTYKGSSPVVATQNLTIR